MAKETLLEMRARCIMEYYKFPDPVKEYQFHPVRRWRFDFAWPEQKIALEMEGGIFTRGRHTRGAAFAADTEKYNQATLLGWRVLRYTVKNLDQIAPDLKNIFGRKLA